MKYEDAEPGKWNEATPESLPPTLQSVILWGILGDEENQGAHEGFLRAKDGVRLIWRSVRGEDNGDYALVTCVSHWQKMPEAPEA